YQQSSVLASTGTDPVVAMGISPAAVSPREIISIFGQNLGPSAPSTAQPVPVACPGVNDGSTGCWTYQSGWNNVFVLFSYTDANGVTQSLAAPVLMTSANQINAIAPKELKDVLSLPSPAAT